jgi:hypothetical protein
LQEGVDIFHFFQMNDTIANNKDAG